MIALTDTATDQGQGAASRPRASPSCTCGSRCVPAAAPACSYEMFFDSEKAADDISRVLRRRAVVVVDPASAQHLDGASLDYKDGLQGAGFTINNPNAQRTCGCGQSFS